MDLITWLKNFFRRNPTLKVSDLEAFQGHVEKVRADFERLKQHVAALNTESLYVRRLLENEKLEEKTEDEEREIDQHYTDRRMNCEWDGPRRTMIDGKKIVRDELGRGYIEETGETVKAYQDRLDQERREALAEVKQKRRRAKAKAQELRAIVGQLPERIDPEELEPVPEEATG